MVDGFASKEMGGCVYFNKAWLEYNFTTAVRESRTFPAAIRGSSTDTLIQAGGAYKSLCFHL